MLDSAQFEGEEKEEEEDDEEEEATQGCVGDLGPNSAWVVVLN